MENQKVLGIDITGTLVHHQSRQWLPMMVEFLEAMRDNNWECVAVTYWPKPVAKRIIGGKAGWLEIFTPGQKGPFMKGLVASYPPDTQFAFIDDKPDNVISVSKEAGTSVRVVGFAGSGEYMPMLAGTCADLGIELASSTDDLFALFDLN